jgi:hypothetical protein
MGIANEVNEFVSAKPTLLFGGSKLGSFPCRGILVRVVEITWEYEKRRPWVIVKHGNSYFGVNRGKLVAVNHPEPLCQAQRYAF